MCLANFSTRGAMRRVLTILPSSICLAESCFTFRTKTCWLFLTMCEAKILHTRRRGCCMVSTSHQLRPERRAGTWHRVGLPTPMRTPSHSKMAGDAYLCTHSCRVNARWLSVVEPGGSSGRPATNLAVRGAREKTGPLKMQRAGHYPRIPISRKCGSRFGEKPQADFAL